MIIRSRLDRNSIEIDRPRKRPNLCFCWQARYFVHVARSRFLFRIWVHFVHNWLTIRSNFQYPNLIAFRHKFCSKWLEIRSNLDQNWYKFRSTFDQNPDPQIWSKFDPNLVQDCSKFGQISALGALLGRSGDAPGRPWALFGRPGVLQGGPGTGFRPKSTAKFDQFLHKFVRNWSKFDRCRA